MGHAPCRTSTLAKSKAEQVGVEHLGVERWGAAHASGEGFEDSFALEQSNDGFPTARGQQSRGIGAESGRTGKERVVTKALEQIAVVLVEVLEVGPLACGCQDCPEVDRVLDALLAPVTPRENFQRGLGGERGDTHHETAGQAHDDGLPVRFGESRTPDVAS